MHIKEFKMKIHLSDTNEKLQQLHLLLQNEENLSRDIDFSLDFIPPYSNAQNTKDIKLIILGQDPTVRNVDSRKRIKRTLNLDKPGSLRNYIKLICNQLDINLESQVYATNLYKCFFHQPPADHPQILINHREQWLNFLKEELSVFNDTIAIITLGEPLVKQLVTSKHKKVSYYWDYIGNSISNKEFKKVEKSDNLLNRIIFPLAHQPSWSRKIFYKNYLADYLSFLNSNYKIH